MAGRDVGRQRWAVAVTAVNVGGFLFHLMLARTFSPTSFGEVAALLSLLVLFQVPANALEVSIGRSVAEHRQRGGDGRPPGHGPLLGATAASSGAMALALVATSPLLRMWLHLPTLGTAALLGAYGLPVAIGAVPKGILFGEGRYGLLGAALVGGSAMQILVGTALVHGGHGVQGALAGMAAGEVATAAILVASLRGRWAGSSGDGTPLGIDDVVSSASAYAGYWTLSVLDVVLAQHYLPGGRAGAYAAAATAARIAVFIPGAVGASAFTRFVADDTRDTGVRLVLLRAVATVGAVGALTTIAVALNAQPLVSVFFSGGYRSAGVVLGALTAAATLTGLSSLLLQHQLAAGRRAAAVACTAGVAVLAASAVAWHASPTDLAAAAVAGTATSTVLLFTLALSGARRPTDDIQAMAALALLDADLELTVVVPYFNPGVLLAANVARLMEVLAASGSDFEVIAVSDGSTDGSETSIGHITDPRLVHVVLPTNRGKGAALRIGLSRGRGRWLGFIDADGDLDPYLLEPFQVLTHLYNPEVILGSKRHPLSEVEYPWLRRVYSRGYRLLTHVLFRLDIGDTQTGIKLIRRDVLAAVLPRMVEKRFAFDLELFVIAQRLGYRRFLEAPVRLRHQFTSTVSWKSVRRTLMDTIAIFYRMRVLRAYDVLGPTGYVAASPRNPQPRSGRRQADVRTWALPK